MRFGAIRARVGSRRASRGIVLVAERIDGIEMGAAGVREVAVGGVPRRRYGLPSVSAMATGECRRWRDRTRARGKSGSSCARELRRVALTMGFARG